MRTYADGMANDGPPTSSEQFWDERYRSAPQLWSGNPNPHLVDIASGLAPTTALDVGAGEGADAIWLAQHGWTVTAVDISSVGLGRGQAQAASLGPEVADRITWIQADVTEWQPPTGAFGLVSAQFMHMASSVREPLFQRCFAAVAPGGTALIVGHDVSDLQTTIRRPPRPDLYFDAAALAGTLDRGWTVLEAGRRARSATDADGNAVTIHDAVVLARRHD